MVGLLALARFLRQQACEPVLMLPRSEEVMKYLDRMDFSRHAERLYAIDLTTLWPDGEYSRSYELGRAAGDHPDRALGGYSLHC